MIRFFGVLILLISALSPDSIPPESGIHFRFKNRDYTLLYGMQQSTSPYFPHAREYNNASLDTLSNWFDPERNYIEFVRQDDPRQPSFGLALGFEFDEENGEYPYTPAWAALQLRDFEWGGVEFGRRDTMNYSGVSNDVSEDIQIEVDGFRNDTVWGKFSGLLLSGAGPMAPIDSGRFSVRVYRVLR